MSDKIVTFANLSNHLKMTKDQTISTINAIKQMIDVTNDVLLEILSSIIKDAYELCSQEQTTYSKIMEMYNSGKSKRQITKEFDRKGTVWLDKYNLDFGKKRQDEVAFYAKYKKSKEIVLSEIKDLYEKEGKTIRQISEYISSHYEQTSSSTIKNWLVESGCDIRKSKKEQAMAKYGIDVDAVLKDLYLNQQLSGSEISNKLKTEYEINISPGGVMSRIRKMGISRDLSAANLIAQNRPSTKIKQKAAQERLKVDPQHRAKMKEGANNGYDVKAKDFVTTIIKEFGCADVYKQFTLDNIDGCPAKMKKKSVDVYCPSMKLAIECDGGRHKTTNDGVKEAFLKSKGIQMIRIYNIDTEEEKEEVRQIVTTALANNEKTVL